VIIYSSVRIRRWTRRANGSHRLKSSLPCAHQRARRTARARNFLDTAPLVDYVSRLAALMPRSPVGVSRAVPRPARPTSGLRHPFVGVRDRTEETNITPIDCIQGTRFPSSRFPGFEWLGSGSVPRGVGVLSQGIGPAGQLCKELQVSEKLQFSGESACGSQYPHHAGNADPGNTIRPRAVVNTRRGIPVSSRSNMFLWAVLFSH
jgi:hypothetical protein